MLSKSLKARLVLAFSIPLVCIVVFGVIYFPQQQKAMSLETVKNQTQTLSEMLAFSVGAGLKDGNFDLVKTAFEWSKKDSSVVYVCILDENDSVIVEHNPKSISVDKKSMLGGRGVNDDDRYISAATPIRYKDRNYGTIILYYSMDAIRARIQAQLWVAVGIGFLIFSLGVAAIVFVTQVILKSFIALLEGMKQFAEGDLTVNVETNRVDEVGKLYLGLNKAVENVNQIMREVIDAVSSTNEASTQIGVSSEELAAGAQEQTSQATEVASAVEEMTKTIVENSRNAGDAADTANRAKQAAEQGGKVVEETVLGMKRIAEVVIKSADTVKALGKSSDQIGEIIGVIDDIADQTNLLALNAAIEAARAGDQGRGFAVVADEVRKLAERTTKATKEIAEMIKKIQKETAGAVKSMEEGTKEVEMGIKLADRAGISLKEIVEISQKVTDMVAQIAAASEQQSTTSEQISRNVEAISNVTSESASGTEQIARAAENLNKLTENLQQLVSRFKLSNDAVPHVKPVSTAYSEGRFGKRSGRSIRDNGKVFSKLAEEVLN